MYKDPLDKKKTEIELKNEIELVPNDHENADDADDFNDLDDDPEQGLVSKPRDLESRDRSDSRKRDDKNRLSIWTLVGLNSFEFSYGLLVSSYLVITLPAEAEHMFRDTHAMMLAAFLGLAGLSQLSGPIAGLLSDRCKSKWGRRRPYLVLGYLVALPTLFLQWGARNAQSGGVYMLAFFIDMLALNVMYASFSGIIPDFVSVAQRGEANGVMALLMVAGACSGFGLFAVLDDVAALYPVYALVLTLGVIVTVWTANEAPSLGSTEQPIDWKEVLRGFKPNYKENPDFFWVFVSRALYYMAISQQTFMLYYFRDVVGAEDPDHYASVLALLAHLTAGPVAYPMGKLSDRVGRVPLVNASCVIIALIYVTFLFTRKAVTVLILGCIFGMANGTYLSVDYALAVDTLPKNDGAAQSLGLWGIAAFLGTMMGPLISGPLLYFLGRTPDSDHYSLAGYSVILTLGAVYMLASGYVLKYLTKPR
eukprot:TRINITY_DN4253_c0_g1::TRINITY_DN4253_c0_g1_i1::g.8061::m.8061 TRINITY_DN4253_c0_g1::TRINITY_DN4253_c0_g1_i1::g.8061  ORF type:complete len:479 (-),score=58.13,sp/O80605/SUC3_ARATH/23.08/1e-06,MFS_1/PF07690.11/2.3e-09,MFS_1/PF07690.11/1e-11,MFS_2/PF13347.1/5.4e-17,PUCC/PF03209.10/0.2,PUCC/PF03209.10/2.6e-05 TRINITY_DN4253_c0_g1_i1:68-1504(-)